MDININAYWQHAHNGPPFLTMNRFHRKKMRCNFGLACFLKLNIVRMIFNCFNRNALWLELGDFHLCKSISELFFSKLMQTGLCSHNTTLWTKCHPFVEGKSMQIMQRQSIQLKYIEFPSVIEKISCILALFFVIYSSIQILSSTVSIVCAAM